MRVVIVGGCGFIGTAFIKYAQNRGVHIVCCDYCAPTKRYDGVEYILLQSENVEVYRSLIQENDIVIILKWKGVPATCSENGRELVENNIVGTMVLVEVCVERKVKKIIFASSGGAIYGDSDVLPIKEEFPTNPISLYAVQKLMVENYLLYVQRTEDIQMVILRISNPYGPGQKPFTGQGIVATFITSALQEKSVEIWGDGNAVRDYIYIEDLSECLHMCVQKDMKSGIYNVGSGVGTSIFEICSNIERIVEKKILYEEKKAGKSQVRNNVLDCSKIFDEIGWKPQVSMQQGLKWSVENEIQNTAVRAGERIQ